MEGPQEDEEFIVITAGPPLPIRRPRTSYPMTFSNLSQDNLTLGFKSRIPRPPSPCPGALSNKKTQTIYSNKRPCLKARPPPPTLQVASKVREYIEQVKKTDEINRLTRAKPEKSLSLEDLYQVPPSLEKDEEVIQDKLRQTLRIIKEKDEMINKLRESCHDLKLKWADAENRVDEMRFGIGVTRSPQGSLERDQGQRAASRRSLSEINLSTVEQEKKVMKDQETETVTIESTTPRVNRSGQPQVTQEEEDGKDFDLDDRQSDFDPVLDEKCTNWLEKVQNWQADSTHNLSQDSCGDRDSGFRGSAELEGHPQPSRKHRSSRTPKSKSRSKSKSKNAQDVPTGISSKSPTPERQDQPPSKGQPSLHFQQYNPPTPGSSSHTATADEAEQSGPSSLQTAQPWFTFSSNLNPQSTTEYQGFPSFSSPNKYELSGAKSMGSLGLFATRYPERNPEDQCQVLRDIDKRFKALHPLLDDATAMALRVKTKSERLAKILQENNNSFNN